MTDSKFSLSHSLHAAELSGHEHYQIAAFNRNKPLDGAYYAGINWRSGQYLACVVTVDDAVQKELSRFYWPGGIRMDFIQQENLNWLVAFRAESALISAYSKLTDDDMRILTDKLITT